MTRLLSSGVRRYLPSNSTQGALATLVGRHKLGSGNAFALASDGSFAPSGTPATSGRIIPFQPGEFRGIRLWPFGVGADNSTFNYVAYLAAFSVGTADPTNPATPQSISRAAEVELMSIGRGTVTLGTTFGLAGSEFINDGERIGDQITWAIATTLTSPPGPQTVWEAAYSLGSVSAYSPADQTAAHLTIPDASGMSGFLIDIDLTGATEANFLYELLR